jgi:hypothetical protein
MSLVDQENTAQQVASRYLLGTVSRLAAFTMDMFARLSILEGAAGVAPGTWLRRSAAGFGDALEHFGPNLAPEWTTTTNQRVYDKAITAASRVLSGSSSLDPADLVQDMVVNSTRASGPDRTRVFYTVGKKLGAFKHNLGDGTVKPRDSKILGTLERWVRGAAITEIKALRSRATRSFGQGEPGYDPTRSIGGQELDDDKRQLLMLLALQSPGGPGAELRRIMDRLIDQHWPRKRERAVVKGFLQKISQPKYRSPAQMRQMVKKFTPARWFTQTVNLVRRELMTEMGVSSQYLTNVLGSKGRNIFKFLREKVANDSSVKRIISALAEEIELLEPGASRVATERRHELTEDQTPLEGRRKVVVTTISCTTSSRRMNTWTGMRARAPMLCTTVGRSSCVLPLVISWLGYPRSSKDRSSRTRTLGIRKRQRPRRSPPLSNRFKGNGLDGASALRT